MTLAVDLGRKATKQTNVIHQVGWGLGEGVVKEGEDDDPEYNYLEEADQEYDKEDFRDDRAVKVSSKLILL